MEIEDKTLETSPIPADPVTPQASPPLIKSKSTLPFILGGVVLLLLIGGGGLLLVKNNHSVKPQVNTQYTTQHAINPTKSAELPTIPPLTNKEVGYHTGPVADLPYSYNWVTATSSDTVGWHNYVDTTNNFSLSYPSDWSENKIGTPNSTLIRLQPKGDTGYIGIGIDTFSNPQHLKSVDYVKNTVFQNEGPGFIINSQPPFFSSLDATVVDGMPGGGSPGPVAFITNKNGTIIELFSDSLNDNTLVSKIFSTFKFTN